jgi:prepilin-type N-terminal cleavage/methylation domain-containing protein
MPKPTKAGFTVIELLVVTAITAFILLAATSMMAVFMLSSAKNNVRRQMKAEGNAAISKIEYEVRDGTGCDSGNTVKKASYNVRVLRDTSTNQIVFSKIIGGTPANTTLTTYTSPSAITFSCTVHAASGKSYVIVSFTLEGTGSNAQIKENFRSIIFLRNS